MKSTFILLGIFLILNTVQSLHVFYPNITAICGKEVGLPAAQAKIAVEHNELLMGCINICVLNKLGALVNGKVVLSTVYDMMENVKDTVSNYEEIKEGIGICYSDVENLKGKTECELGLILSQCMSSYARS